jgi:hypothetical protein
MEWSTVTGRKRRRNDLGPPIIPPFKRTFPVVDPADPVRGEKHPKPNNFAARYFERWS